MSRRSRSSSYSGYYSSYSSNKGGERRIPNPLPYLIVVLLAVAGLAYFHMVVFKSLSGKVTNAYTGAPMPGITVVLQPATQPITATSSVTGTATISGTSFMGTPPSAIRTLTATTTADGSFAFPRVPEVPVLTVAVDGFTQQQVDASGKSVLNVALVPNHLTGKVVGPDGKGIAGARIFGGAAWTVAGGDGSYAINDLPAERKLVVKAGGYLAKTVTFDKVSTLDIPMQPFVPKAIYISADSAATPGKLQQLESLLDTTELNAAVIDVKADNTGVVLYNSSVPIIKQLNTSRQVIPDLPGLIKTLKAKNIYTIARIPTFWDQAATAAKPEWALKSKKAPGQIWADTYGKHWLNPFLPDVWAYNIAIAKEVASFGFDEVQFDDVQFPSDGDLNDIDFGPQSVGKSRADAINSFLDEAYTALSPAGTYLAVDVFGLTPWVQDDMGVGQNFEAVAQRSDYICPAIYPALFADNFNGYQHPMEHPFEIVSDTVKQALGRFSAKTVAHLRPWLQDFSSGTAPFDPTKVRSEIDAAQQSGASGWMLWNFGNTYSQAALKP